MKTSWKRASADIFWGEIAPSDNVVQIYESDEGIFGYLATDGLSPRIKTNSWSDANLQL